MSTPSHATGEAPMAPAPTSPGCGASAMAPTHLRVLGGGLGCSVQDAGRHGLRDQGIAPAGWLDGRLAECANALLGNPPGSAVVELRGPGLVVQADDAPVAVVLALLATARHTPSSRAPSSAAGGASGSAPAHGLATGPVHTRPAARIRRADGRTEPLPAFTTATLLPGDQLHCTEPAQGGAAYLGLSGGVQVPPQLGSRATHAGARLGGLNGRLLAAGDTLPCLALGRPGMPLPALATQRMADAYCHAEGPIRVLPGPQTEAFTPEALARFHATDWETTHEQDRMGLRLAGPVLAHASAAAADIVSDGVATGSIQVPANGLPIVLLADGQTVGGYPKIANIVTADLPRLAHARPGTRLRFEPVTRAQALAALREAGARWQAWTQTIRPVPPAAGLDEAALYQVNLISGIIHHHPLDD